MERLELTEELVESIMTGQPKLVWDTLAPGLHVRHTARSGTSYCYRYTHGSISVLGRVGRDNLALSTAREMALEYRRLSDAYKIKKKKGAVASTPPGESTLVKRGSAPALLADFPHTGTLEEQEAYARRLVERVDFLPDRPTDERLRKKLEEFTRTIGTRDVDQSLMTMINDPTLFGRHTRLEFEFTYFIKQSATTLVVTPLLTKIYASIKSAQRQVNQQVRAGQLDPRDDRAVRGAFALAMAEHARFFHGSPEPAVPPDLVPYL